MFVLGFLNVHDAVQPAFDVIELRGGNQVLIAFRQNLLDFLLRLDDALGGRRMVGKYLGDAPGLAPLLLDDFPKEGNAGLRGVAGLVYVLDTESGPPGGFLFH